MDYWLVKRVADKEKFLKLNSDRLSWTSDINKAAKFETKAEVVELESLYEGKFDTIKIRRSFNA